ncbi:GlcT-1 [Bugula neritina]|uniref:GlcT-1 n=1 Tax=Bugula neritina TaxID=10212 RepID=A0A7J7IVD3_BUGNE|nr:GlcT-1 [Bugula neritina]
MHKALYGVDWSFVMSCIMILAWSIVWMIYFGALVYGKCHLHKKVTDGDTEQQSSCLPGVSIVKPLCSVLDSNLKENLITFFELNYPKFELLFCIQDRNENLIQLVNELMLQYPKLNLKSLSVLKTLLLIPKSTTC